MRTLINKRVKTYSKIKWLKFDNPKKDTTTSTIVASRQLRNDNEALTKQYVQRWQQTKIAKKELTDYAVAMLYGGW